MGKSVLCVEYANNRKVYAPGDVVEGAVVFELKKAKKVKKIKVVATGEAKVKLKTNDRKQIRNAEKYFHFNFDVYQGTDSELTAKQHKFPFRFTLKPNLPTSYEGSLGHVRYSIQAIVEYPGLLSTSLKCLSAFTVLDTVNLNAVDGVRQAQRIYCQKRPSGMCCFRKPGVTVNLATEKSGYVPGEFIVVNGIIANGRSKPVRSLKVDLHQQVTFYGRQKNAAATSPLISHQVTNSVASWDLGSKVIPGGKTEDWQRKQLMQIPALIPSGLRHCKVMDVQYFLEVTLVVPGKITGSELKGKSNLLTIGSVPLRPLALPSSYQQPPTSQPAVASAPPPAEMAPNPSAPPPPYEPGETAFASVPLPTYEEAVTGGASLRAIDHEEGEDNQEIVSPDTQFTPQYTFFDFSQPAFNPAFAGGQGAG